MVRMPILKFPSEIRLALALSPEWRQGAIDHLRWLGTEQEAAEIGTSFHLATLPIPSGCIVAVLGSEMAHALREVGFGLQGWSTIQEGFRIRAVQPEEYTELANQFAQLGKTVFDQEFTTSYGRMLTDKAAVGLLIMRGSPASKLDEQTVRTLIAQELRQDAVAFAAAWNWLLSV